jgi:hypothetical protein
VNRIMRIFHFYVNFGRAIHEIHVKSLALLTMQFSPEVKHVSAKSYTSFQNQICLLLLL